MSTPENWLLCNRLRALAEGLEDAEGDEAAAIWQRMEQAIDAAGADEDADLALPILEQSLPEVHALFAAWKSGAVHLADWDQAVLKRALKAYRKRLKLMRLDDESSGSRDPLSRGGSSSILGMKPPEQYPQEVWDLLVELGRLRDGGHGLLELATS